MSQGNTAQKMASRSEQELIAAQSTQDAPTSLGESYADATNSKTKLVNEGDIPEKVRQISPEKVRQMLWTPEARAYYEEETVPGELNLVS